MAQTAGQQSGSTPVRSVVSGAVAGVAAYVVGYVVTLVLVVVESDGDSIDTSDFFLEVVGWVFYNAQFVPTETTASGLGQSTSQTANLLAEATNLTVPRPAWTIAVVAVLVVAGYAAARGTGSPLAGGSVVVGYLPLAVAGTFVFEVSQSALGGSATVAPETLPAVLAGIAFPVVCGVAGGLLASGGDL